MISADSEFRWMEASGEIVRLSVGGKVFTTYVNTISQYGDSLFAVMLSGRYKLNYDEGAIFLDRDPKLFKHILNFLIEKDKWEPPTDFFTRKRLLQEFDYFSIPAPFSLLEKFSSSSILTYQSQQTLFSYMEEDFLLIETVQSPHHEQQHNNNINNNNDKDNQNIYQLENLQNKKVIDVLRNINYTPFKLIYSTTSGNFKNKDFHDHCDNKGPTFCIIRFRSGIVAGGYTSQSWQSTPLQTFVSDKTAFLFFYQRGDDITKLAANNFQTAISYHADFGPIFGDYQLSVGEVSLFRYDRSCLDFSSPSSSVVVPFQSRRTTPFLFMEVFALQ
jgi:Zn ribbon nucleic-acid-binding protein